MKLSTDKIRALLSSWLTTPDMETKVKEWCCLIDEMDAAELSQVKTNLKLKQSASVDDVREALWKLWSNPKAWKRESKGKIGEDWKSFLYQPDKWHNAYEFAYDFAGDGDLNLVQKYCNNPSDAEKLIRRMFIPNNDFGDNFRLEVLTTPDDTEVVGWCITVD